LRFLWFYQVQSIWLVETTWIGLAGFRPKTACDAGVSLDCVTKYAMAQAVAAVPSLPPGVSPASEKTASATTPAGGIMDAAPSSMTH
jgi:hypothetical protein